jgi:hypothetical protein
MFCNKILQSDDKRFYLRYLEPRLLSWNYIITCNFKRSSQSGWSCIWAGVRWLVWHASVCNWRWRGRPSSITWIRIVPGWSARLRSRFAGFWKSGSVLMSTHEAFRTVRVNLMRRGLLSWMCSRTSIYTRNACVSKGLSVHIEQQSPTSVTNRFFHAIALN